MKRNEERIWFNKGYREGCNDTRKDAFWPKIIGVWSLILVSWWHLPVALIFLAFYTAFEYFEYRDREKFRPDVEVPPLWEK
jgi:hypothetical protein